jgi:hypothetical protein
MIQDKFAQPQSSSKSSAISLPCDSVHTDNVDDFSHFIWIELRLNLDEAYSGSNDILKGAWGFGNYGSSPLQTDRPFPLANSRFGLISPDGTFEKLIFSEPKINRRQASSMMEWSNESDSITIGVEFGSQLNEVKILEILGISGDQVTDNAIAWSIIMPLPTFDNLLYGLHDFPEICIEGIGHRARLIKCCTSMFNDELGNPIIEFVFDGRTAVTNCPGASDQDTADSEDFLQIGFG